VDDRRRAWIIAGVLLAVVIGGTILPDLYADTNQLK
jgi:hypothetical protein